MAERDPDPIVMYIIVRSGLKMSAGKVGAQCGHAVQYLMQEVLPDRHPTREEILLRTKLGGLTDAERLKLEAYDAHKRHRFEHMEVTRAWLDGDHAKIVLSATDEEFGQVLRESPWPFLVTDLGYTQVEAGTHTALGLWPCRKSEAPPTVKTLRPLR
jgi:peptidyl-tRNA hydrolase